MAGAGRTRYGGRPLADWVDGCIAPSLARFGFGEVDIVSGWADIAGPRVAAFAEPVEIKWPRKGASSKMPKPGADDPPEPGGGRPPATLVVRVEGAFALELQHLAPLLIERINAHLGWRCIGKLALRQAPLAGRPARAAPTPPPKPAAIAAARDLTGGIDDEGLRDALVRLGARSLKAR
ncbi:DUF721 domain-containing protein [Lichenibacterium minor]|uniref:DUF721 domain-containing protein n=1 Tax=Lichenibacterium minor TaxID=2316528 RepID=A0A4Q2U7G5_9HYPH|nr:DciA family protein [Lichenibacterium minor]RYC30815.1 DUF721 domain-containing protein [Lichenibacterium minor]